ncbi:sensor histidine kinase [Clavibacter michiganensis]|uniref:histidine kinase n=3 Tax=Clavibacter michiganensis TaxID=28447 RepID=A0A0D5CEF0_9MICO|nr:histidine kinase [Clavibacter michiganensis]AJW78033.1 histidine kinase [Clavibacter michiganensis subsp. insidiosus]AWF99592.1 histidine kinase [Clavibacter michiganensis subsp. insidiosus]AWG00289.1 histidine kinase [Clavibacter michiganensis subsp. insidiosus]OQJ61069.1 sensor histidine kinase [Clavibacter michiganensis subsp. insidiosus]RMC85789.1 sensor histidine kinase [Clavibacter michiganensis subsp. insidiosus]
MSAASAPDSVDRFWVRPRPDRAGLRFDVILALVMLVLTTFSVMQYYALGMYPTRPAVWVIAAWILLVTLPLAFRRLQPEAVTLVIAAVFIIGAYQFVPEVLFSNIAMFIAMYSLGAWGRNRVRAHIVRGVIVVGMFAWLFSALLQASGFYSLNASIFENAPDDAWIPAPVASGLVTIITNLLYFGGAWYFGDRAWASARDRCALETRTAELATERERVAEQAVTLERVRIARELHDVVAHHVSVMGVHAGAARRVLARDAEKAAASLGIVEDNARSAIEELHRMLVALRQEEDDRGSDDGAGADPTRTASTRGVDQLHELVADACGAGLTVAYDVIGTPRPLTPTVDLIVYRVAQESLTNVRKHAGAGTRVDLRLRYLAERVEVEVSDGGPAGAAASAAPAQVRGGPGGLGQRGMRERVAAVGGSIEIGPKARGGYLVRASVPTGPTPVVPPVPMPVPLDVSIPEETRA